MDTTTKSQGAVAVENRLKGDVLDVILRYEDGYKIVNMDKVKAVSWHKTKVDAKPETGGDADVPGTVVHDLPHIEPAAVADITAASEETRAGTVCFWTGKEWVCGRSAI